MTSDVLRYGFTTFMINHKSVMNPSPDGDRDGAT